MRVTPNDGYVDGDYAEATITIINSGPEFDVGASITPSSPVYTGTVLTCSASASDLDDGILAVSYSWSVGGVQIATGSTYTVSSSDTDVGDGITCTANAVDSDGSSRIHGSQCRWA